MRATRFIKNNPPKHAVVRAYAGTGKEQDVRCKVQTPNGPVEIGCLGIGDEIFSSDGQIQKVVGVFPQGRKDSYKVTFRDGFSTYCGKEHLWLVSQRGTKDKVVSLHEMLTTGIKYSNGLYRYKIPLCDPVEYPEQEQTIDPYLLGLLIADGSLTETTIKLSFNAKDLELVHYFKELCEGQFKINFKHTSENGIQTGLVPINKKYHNAPSWIKDEIVRLKLNERSHKKRIPKQYLYGSIEQRKKLLRGLMDADGCSRGNRIGYTTTSKQLKDDICELVQSLGGTAIVGSLDKRGKRPCYAINIKTFFNPFKASSKRYNWKFSTKNPPSRYITKIERVGKAEQICIKVSSKDQLYLTDNYIVTHNTFSLIMGVAHAYGKKRWKDIIQQFAEHKSIPLKGFKVTPSEEQKQIWKHLASIKDVKKITYCAFNRSIVEEFNRDWGWLVTLLAEEGIELEFRTINSLGARAIYSGYGRCGVTGNYAEELISRIMGKDLYELRRYDNALLQATNKLVALSKLSLFGWDENTGFDPDSIDEDDIQGLADYYDIDMNGSASKICDLVPKVLRLATDVDNNRTVDYNDQNWIPIVNNLSIPKSDLVLVDEAQDLPRCKQEFVRKFGRNIVCVGDVWQAIYGFAGADVSSIPRMEELLGVTKPFHLTETRRCAKVVVKEAQKIVADFKAHESNPEGFVGLGWYDQGHTNYYGKHAKDGDMCLCRVNGPLVSEALRFIKNGRKAVIRGRDFGKSLINFVNKLKASSVDDLVQKVEAWHDSEVKKESKKRFVNEAKLVNLADRKECILAFTEDAIDLQDVTNKISLVFSGKECPLCKQKYNEETERCQNKACKVEPDPSGGKWKVGPKLVNPEGVMFSSIHRAKGLEADRVFLLQPKGAEIPHPMAKTPWQKGQEMNLLYVAITRAKEELVYVS